MSDTPADRQLPGQHHPELEGQVAVLEALMARMEPLLQQLVADMSATRADLAELKGSTRADLAELRTSIGHLPTVSDMLATRAEFAELKGSVTHLPSTWQMMTAIIGGQVAFAAVIAAIVFGVLRYVGHGG